MSALNKISILYNAMVKFGDGRENSRETRLMVEIPYNSVSDQHSCSWCSKLLKSYSFSGTSRSIFTLKGKVLQMKWRRILRLQFSEEKLTFYEIKSL